MSDQGASSSDKYGLPDSIIKKLFDIAPPNICLRLASTCKRYRQMMLEIRGLPITKATFIVSLFIFGFKKKVN